MERRIESDQNFIDSGTILPSPFQRTATYRNFGGIRHGFNTPVSNRTHYHPTAHFSVYTSMLPSFNSLPSPPFDFSFGTAPASRAPMYLDQFPNSGMQRVRSLGEDFQMMAPAPSRRTSDMPGLESTVQDLGTESPPCVCETGGQGTPIIELATEAWSLMEQQPYPRVPVQQLLNPTPPSFTYQNQALNPGQISTSHDASNGNVQRLPTPTSISMSICSTTTESDTIVPPHNISAVEEERTYLLTQLYRTCLSASTCYLYRSPRVIRCRRGASARYHPYGPRQRKEEKSSLMDNISSICTRLWRKARRDVMAPHRKEARAVREMRDLYVWGKVVVVGGCMENGDLEDEEVESEIADLGDEDAENANEEAFPGMKVAKAAKGLCQWFGDKEAWDTCDTVMDRLRVLAQHEDDGIGGSWSEEGSIL